MTAKWAIVAVFSVLLIGGGLLAAQAETGSLELWCIVVITVGLLVAAARLPVQPKR